eukprot:10835618-Karenia_brevis.AAC.1
MLPVSCTYVDQLKPQGWQGCSQGLAPQLPVACLPKRAQTLLPDVPPMPTCARTIATQGRHRKTLLQAWTEVVA